MTLASKIDFLHVFWGSLPLRLVTWANRYYGVLVQRKTAWKAAVHIITEQTDLNFWSHRTLGNKKKRWHVTASTKPSTAVRSLVALRCLRVAYVTPRSPALDLTPDWLLPLNHHVRTLGIVNTLTETLLHLPFLASGTLEYSHQLLLLLWALLLIWWVFPDTVLAHYSINISCKKRRQFIAIFSRKVNYVCLYAERGLK